MSVSVSVVVYYKIWIFFHFFYCYTSCTCSCVCNLYMYIQWVEVWWELEDGALLLWDRHSHSPLWPVRHRTTRLCLTRYSLSTGQWQVSDACSMYCVVSSFSLGGVAAWTVLYCVIRDNYVNVIAFLLLFKWLFMSCYLMDWLNGQLPSTCTYVL